MRVQVLFTVVLVPTALLGGCILNLSAGGASGGDTSGQASGGSGGADADALAAQEARKREVTQHVAQVIYQGAPVLQSVQTADGDRVDGLDRSKLPALPYPLPDLPYLPSDVSLPPGVTFGISDVDKDATLADLVSNMAGYRRPDFTPYILGQTDATSVQDYLDRYEVGGAPQGPPQLYAGLVSMAPNRGISAYVSQYKPDVANGSLSIIELAVGCPADVPTEMVGITISVDRVNVGGRNEQGVFDGLPRLHIEYATTKNGQMKYSWDGLDGKFVSNPIRSKRPGQVVPVSVVGGATVEHLLTIFQVPTGDWWVAYDMNLLGYYPAKLFTMLGGGGCGARWYGETYNPNPPHAVETEMGSGKFATAGLTDVAYIRKPVFFDLSWISVEPQDMWTSQPFSLSCYTRTLLHPDPVSGDHVFTLGGPGGKDPQCKWPTN